MVYLAFIRAVHEGLAPEAHLAVIPPDSRPTGLVADLPATASAAHVAVPLPPVVSEDFGTEFVGAPA